MTANNFYTSCFKYFICIYFLFLLKYILFTIRIYVEEGVIFWEWYFLYDNLKTALVIYIPYFFISFCRYKYHLKKEVH
ncbi:hypothetical protein UMN179_02243 [Gallibacterium anatis UMN179]|uniref:Uncharacterized protein n=2 Tax=Gallibacterium anatis TaxID=750 RepID=F4HFQ3_GALAU|nr:hypothetical protein UMN179_02243 [Gallibacterium anatis UMN179]KGQ59040.1 hypothetical protein IO48_12310 [Gallibacterium anatis 4895]